MISLNNIKMRPKLTGLFMAVGLLPLALVGWFATQRASDELMHAEFNQLTAVREIKKAQLAKYFEERKGDMGVLLDVVAAQRHLAIQKLETAQELQRMAIERSLENERVALATLKDDPYVHDALAAFGRAFEKAGNKTGSAEWQALVARHENRLKDIMTDNGWYDLFLIRPDGHVAYTVAKEPDLGMNIPNSELKDSPLGKAFQALQDPKMEFAFGDFAPYSPSQGAQAAFMMARLVNDKGALEGFVAIQMPTDKLNAIVQSRAGMGKTGESYLVGKIGDGKAALRSDRVVRSGKIGDAKNDTTSLAAVDGKTGVQVKVSSQGILQISLYAPIRPKGLNLAYGIVTSVDAEEVFADRLDGEKEDFFTKYVKKYGYYDLFLIDPHGMAFYTVGHEPDYQTNLLNGKYADSNLGRLVKQVLHSKKYGLADFSPYAPSNGEPAGFIAQPLLGSDGEVEMVVALQLPLDALNAVMQQREGMGKTGETYLVGSDKRMRSDSFLDKQGHSVKASFAGTVEKNGVDTEASRAALAGQSETRLIIDYNGNPVLSSYTPLKVEETTWAVLAEIDLAEVNEPITALHKTILLLAAGIALLVTLLALYVANTSPRRWPRGCGWPTPCPMGI